jgi:segregation and condensation protein B
MTEANPKIEPSPASLSIPASLEALLFVAAGPVTFQQLAEGIGIKVAEVEQGLKELSAHFENGRGLRLQFHGGRVQLTTAPEISGVIEKFLGLDTSSKLSRAALETMAIIAYRQPITRPGIDAIRGVNSDGVLKSLLSKGLVQEVGRAEGPGRPVLFGVTSDFLQHFGLSKLDDLPPFEILEADKEEPGNGRLLKD